MKPVLLIDFGSTYTKVTAVDVDAAVLLGTASAFTTVQTDVGEGLDHALASLYQTTGALAFSERYACSSAAGGLKMLACGLVPSLTAEAAKRAALSAGAKVLKTYSYRLTEDDLAEIALTNPDIFLLTGGTDGGNRENIEENARALATVPGNFPILLAGNRESLSICKRILSASMHPVTTADNVMPVFGQLHVAPVQAEIRKLFLSHIIEAKGLTRQQSLLSGIVMPTPAAVLAALSLYAKAMGDLVAVDLGGATTDVYSIADGLPTDASAVLRGLPEPREKRTVEGDMGMRYSANGLVEAAGYSSVCDVSGLSPETVARLLAEISAHPNLLQTSLDNALATQAIALGIQRHTGHLEPYYTPQGLFYQQTGKDLTRADTLILTGGALIHADNPAALVKNALSMIQDPLCLAPRNPQVLVDTQYLLSAMGLLTDRTPAVALTLMRQTLKGA